MSPRKAPAITPDGFALPTAAGTALAVSVPTSAAEVAALQHTIEQDSPTYLAVVADDADTYTFADELLTEIVQRADAAKAMRSSATRPLYGVIKTVEGWFAPYLSALAAVEGHLKRTMGAYQVRRVTLEAEAREIAAVAIETDDPDALVAALAVATEAAEKPVAAARVAYAWEIEREIPDMWVREFMTLDRVRVAQEIKKAGSGEAPPVVPGVVFRRVAKIGASHR